MKCEICGKNFKKIKRQIYCNIECRNTSVRIKSIIRQISNEIIIEFIKNEIGCQKCNNKNLDHSCLEFHHINNKDNIVGRLNQSSVYTLLDEINKCKLFCANCHRLIHNKDKMGIVKQLK